MGVFLLTTGVAFFESTAAGLVCLVVVTGGCSVVAASMMASARASSVLVCTVAGLVFEVTTLPGLRVGLLTSARDLPAIVPVGVGVVRL